MSVPHYIFVVVKCFFKWKNMKKGTVQKKSKNWAIFKHHHLNALVFFCWTLKWYAPSNDITHKKHRFSTTIQKYSQKTQNMFTHPIFNFKIKRKIYVTDMFINTCSITNLVNGCHLLWARIWNNHTDCNDCNRKWIDPTTLQIYLELK